MREDAIVPGLDRWLASLFEPDHLDATCPALAAAGEPDPDAAQREEELRQRLAECDRTLDAYRSVVREQPETAAEVRKWIVETLQERKRLERQLGRTPRTKLSKEDVKTLAASLKDIVAVLVTANPVDRAEAYADLGISLTYHPDNSVTVESRPRVSQVRVGGASPPLATPALKRSEALELRI